MKSLLIEIGGTLKHRFVTLLPKLIVAFIVFGLAYVVIGVIRRWTRNTLDRVMDEKENAVKVLWTNLTGVFLWFGTSLVLLNVLGLDSLAAGLGTATGFVALGVSFALKDVISDLVAGIYLIRDEDFQPGDRISTSVVTGQLKQIELRKCRFENDDGNAVIVANTDVEKQWTKVTKPVSTPDGNSENQEQSEPE